MSERSPLHGQNSSLVVTTRLFQEKSEGVENVSLPYPIEEFGSWLERTKDSSIVLKKKGVKSRDLTVEDVLVLPYLHRFKEGYVRKTLSKFDMIMKDKRGEPYVHLTLTCYRSFSISEAIKRLKSGWNKLRTYFRDNGYDGDYLVVLEPHKDGYPHLHILWFTHRYLINQAKLSGLWQKYGVGEVVYVNRYWNWGRDSRGMRYLTKYLTKFYKDVPKVLKFLNGQTSDFKKRFVKRILFYAWLWKGRYMTYSFSRGLSILWKKEGGSSGEWELWFLFYGSIGQVWYKEKEGWDVLLYDFEVRIKDVFDAYGVRRDMLLDKWVI